MCPRQTDVIRNIHKPSESGEKTTTTTTRERENAFNQNSISASGLRHNKQDI